jgi:hypothetical protein
MAIRVGNDAVTAIGSLAEKAGQAEASQIEAQRAEERFIRAQQMQQQEKMAQMQMQNQWDMVEFEANLQNNAKKMAMQWELQKAAIASQHDFDLREWEKEAEFKRDALERMKKQDEFELIKKQINDNANITPEQKEDMVRRATARHFGYNPDEIYGQEQGELELLRIDAARQEMGLPMKYHNQETIQTQLTDTAPAQYMEGQGKFSVDTQRDIQATKENKTKVVSPEGVIGYIDIKEWPEHKSKGFELYNDFLYNDWKNKYEGLESKVDEQFADFRAKQLLLGKARTKMKRKNPSAWDRYLEEMRASVSEGNQ